MPLIAWNTLVCPVLDQTCGQLRWLDGSPFDKQEFADWHFTYQIASSYFCFYAATPYDIRHTSTCTAPYQYYCKFDCDNGKKLSSLRDPWYSFKLILLSVALMAPDVCAGYVLLGDHYRKYNTQTSFHGGEATCSTISQGSLPIIETELQYFHTLVTKSNYNRKH